MCFNSIRKKFDLKHELTQDNYDMLKQILEAAADQYLPNQKKNQTMFPANNVFMLPLKANLKK